MPLDHKDLEALAQLEAHSRRTKPLLLGGLLAIALGFLVLIGYLQNERVIAQRRAEDLDKRVASLTATLDHAQALLAQSAHQETPAQDARISDVLANATAQVAELQAAAAPAPLTPSPAPTGPVRVFIHITSEDQRPMAAQVQADLANQSFDGQAVTVPPDIRMTPPHRTTTLRCLKVPDCQRANRLAQVINGRLTSPHAVVVDLSQQYDKSPAVRPGTFELWFGDGPITPKD